MIHFDDDSRPWRSLLSFSMHTFLRISVGHICIRIANSYRLLLSIHHCSTNAYNGVNCKLNYTHTRVESHKHWPLRDRYDVEMATLTASYRVVGYGRLEQILISSSARNGIEMNLHSGRDEPMVRCREMTILNCLLSYSMQRYVVSPTHDGGQQSMTTYDDKVWRRT